MITIDQIFHDAHLIRYSDKCTKKTYLLKVFSHECVLYTWTGSIYVIVKSFDPTQFQQPSGSSFTESFARGFLTRLIRNAA